MNRPKMTKSQILLAVGSSIFLLIVIVAILNPFSFKKELISEARGTLLESLKSPSSAKFIGKPEIKRGIMLGSTYCGNLKDFDGERSEDPTKYFYAVSMTVDAENSYGAQMREDYVCVIQPIGTSCDDLEGFNNYREMCDDGSFQDLGLY